MVVQLAQQVAERSGQQLGVIIKEQHQLAIGQLDSQLSAGSGPEMDIRAPKA